MALRVWLPLNGTLENKGISEIALASGTPTYVNGKIGLCLGTGTLTFNLPQNFISNLSTSKKYSICCWCKNLDTSVSGRWVFLLGNGTGTSRGLWEGNSTSNRHWAYSGSGTNMHTSINTIDGNWHHLVFIVNGSKVTLYVDGIYQSEITESTSAGALGGSNTFQLNASSYNLNDFRIYDHCLSAKEVKEISQGLILHYKLDEIIGNNLLEKSLDASGQDEDGYLVKAYNLTENLVNGGVYTVTAKLTVSSDKKAWGVWVGGGSYLAGSMFQISNLTDIYTKTFTANSNMSDKTFINVYVSNNNGTQGSTPVTGTSYIHWIKIERGDISTGWSPSSNEVDVHIPDSSGYGNDGTIVGTLTAQQDTERYGVSTDFAASSAVNCGRGAMVTDSITVNLWSKYSTYSNLVSCTEGGGWNFENNSGLTFPVYVSSVGYVHIDAASRPAVANYANSWHMFTGTYDRLKQLTSLYIDGELIGTGSVSAPNQIQYNSSNVIWINAEATGSSETATYGNSKSFSDFRIYATALSAEDILDLYHTSMNIDDMNVIHSFELVEQSGNMFAGSPLAGSLTWDSSNNYYTITSSPSTSTWGIGPSVGITPKKIIPWGMSYILTYEVYSPTAAQWYIDYNNNDPTTSLSGNDNDNGRLRTGVNVPANTWTLITYGCSNTNETKNPNHLPLYDYSTGLGPVMTNISSAITWHMRNPQWYLVDADNKEHVYENGVFQVNFLKEDDQSSYTSFRNEEKAVWSHNFIEK